MKWKLKDYNDHKKTLKRLLERSDTKCRRVIASEYAACAGVPLAVMLIYVQELEGLDLSEDIQGLLTFFDAEIV